ncbi:MAG: hypothetical protein E6J91_06165 [Deltaproteobacteria bacterium]|nr:MAG: hypothetical protein E6J91_06165 [Deltaproteobacteria bacterium]
MSTTQPAQPSQKFKLDRITNGRITFLALHGILDETFEGQKVAESVRTKKIVVSLREVRRLASWGMAEWMNFLRATADRDLYLVECSTYAVNQMNLVTGLMGHGKLVSFYAPYRCGSCSEEFETLMLVPVERASLRDLPDREKACATCGGSARMDRYPATMCKELTERAVFDIDDEVVEFLRTHLNYDLAPDLNRFRAMRRVSKGNVYLRLSGNIAALPAELLAKASEGTTVVDMANILFDPEELTAWRSYVKEAMVSVASLQLLDCPPGFLEAAVRPEDLQTKLKIRTFALQYFCPTCNTSVKGIVDVAENLEQLADGAVPVAYCPTCQSALVPRAAESVLLLRRLPARERDPELDAFVARTRAVPVDKLEDCLVARPAKPARASAVSRFIVVAPLAALVLLSSGVVLYVWKQRQEPAPVAGATAPVIAPPATPAFPRPDWINSDSSYRRTKEEGMADANDAALEELVIAIGVKISEPFFQDNVVAGYSAARTKAFAALQATEIDRSSPAYAAADDAVRKVRRRVVEILQGSGGAAVPARQADWYWEEYKVEKGAGTEYLVFVRYDISTDAVKSLVERYSATTQVNGSAVMTAFPALAWQYPDFTGGAILTKVGGPLAGAVAPQQIVMAAGDQRVLDAGGLARRVEDWKRATGDLALTVKAGDGPAKVIQVHH